MTFCKHGKRNWVWILFPVVVGRDDNHEEGGVKKTN